MKKGMKRKMNKAIERIAKHYEYGTLVADTNPDEFLEMVADSLDMFYKTRTFICSECGKLEDKVE
jgi:hypothetical protein